MPRYFQGTSSPMLVADVPQLPEERPDWNAPRIGAGMLVHHRDCARRPSLPSLENPLRVDPITLNPATGLFEAKGWWGGGEVIGTGTTDLEAVRRMTDVLAERTAAVESMIPGACTCTPTHGG